MKITAEMVKELRNATGAGVLEAKQTLEATDGDFDDAVARLRKKGAAQVEKRAGRVASEGVIEVYGHPGNRVGVMVELNCETDFVARNDLFQSLAHDLALHVAAMQPRYVDRNSVPPELLSKLKDKYSEQAAAEGKPDDIVEKIVDGRINKFYAEVCLLEQQFVKDDEVKVQDLVTDAIRILGENIVIRRFERYELGVND